MTNKDASYAIPRYILSVIADTEIEDPVKITWVTWVY